MCYLIILWLSYIEIQYLFWFIGINVVPCQKNVHICHPNKEFKYSIGTIWGGPCLPYYDEAFLAIIAIINIMLVGVVVPNNHFFANQKSLRNGPCIISTIIHTPINTRKSPYENFYNYFLSSILCGNTPFMKYLNKNSRNYGSFPHRKVFTSHVFCKEKMCAGRSQSIDHIPLLFIP